MSRAKVCAAVLEINFGLSWEYKGKKGKETLFHTAIGSFQAALRNWAPAFKLIVAEVLAPFVEKQFETEGAEGGVPWQELAESTRANRPAGPILHLSGALAGSFREGGADHVEDISREKLRWGSRVPYALFHQTGTGKGFQKSSVATGPGTGRGMAMRKILVLTEPMKRRMRSVMVGRLAQIARQEGYRVLGADAGDPLTARRIGQSLLGGGGQ